MNSQIEKIDSVLKNVRFFNTKFHLKEGNIPIVVMVSELPDSRDRSKKIKVYQEQSISDEVFNHPNFEEFIVTVCYRMVQNQVVHETSELFFYKGVDIYNEHRESTGLNCLLNEMLSPTNS